MVPMNATLRAGLMIAAETALSDFLVEYAGGRVGSIRKGFDGATARAGLADVTPHTCRHSAAVHMAVAGVPMTKISQFLGHSNSGITERTCARFGPDHMADAANVLNFNLVRKVQ